MLTLQYIILKSTDVLNQLTIWGPIVAGVITYVFLDRRRSEGAKPLTDEERFSLYVDGIKDRRMQRIYEFKLNRCYQWDFVMTFVR